MYPRCSKQLLLILRIETTNALFRVPRILNKSSNKNRCKADLTTLTALNCIKSSRIKLQSPKVLIENSMMQKAIFMKEIRKAVVPSTRPVPSQRERPASHQDHLDHECLSPSIRRIFVAAAT